MDEIRSIDIVEKMRSYLLGEAPAIEKWLISYREQADEKLPEHSPESLKLHFLALVLNEDIDTAVTKRKIRLVLNWIESPASPTAQLSKTEKFSVSETSLNLSSIFPEKKLKQIKKHLSRIEELFSEKDGNLFHQLRENKSGIVAVNLIRQNFPLLRGLRAYQFLLSLGYGIVIPDKPRQRLLFRLGFLRKIGTTPELYQRVVEITEELHRLSGETLAGLNLLLGLFSGAIKWSAQLNPVCVQQPDCFLCPLTNYCSYYQYGGKQTAKIKFSRKSQQFAQELPREKLLLYGSSRLSNSELLAIILRTGTAEIPSTELGKKLLSKFETLENIYATSIKELSEVPGIGKIKAIEIKAALELGKRLTASEGPNLGVVTSSKDVFHLYQGQLAQKKQEVFLVLLLDMKNRIFKQIDVSQGTLNASLVHPREVFKDAIRESAASVIFIHNHPSGDPKPSHDDIALTHRLYEVGEIIGINVLDHLIIAGNKYFSFADNNLLRNK